MLEWLSGGKHIIKLIAGFEWVCFLGLCSTLRTDGF